MASLHREPPTVLLVVDLASGESFREKPLGPCLRLGAARVLCARPHRLA
ncbi:hypothetical protein OHA91_33735 [Streptomyces erythrochromogenes]|uniref:Uncharacterized protein n=1 Tax=Streptomyces erythrochromogenes TaxID=285574 RepID=A0ABZ1QKW4_9ACTN|nr:hypothetical protein [Streptomyces erythrochromogenes]